jgi:peptidoglycan/xylan/chitin deacetylase (PgdA/CDA1 family)
MLKRKLIGSLVKLIMITTVLGTIIGAPVAFAEQTTPTYPNSNFDSVAEAMENALGSQNEIEPLAINVSAIAKPLTIPVLCYHQVLEVIESTASSETQISLSKFDSQMNYLKTNNFNPITMSQLSGYLNNNKTLPNKPILITFDDGWEDQYWNAVPVLDKYGFKATFFIIGNTLTGTWPGYMTKAKIIDLKKRGYDIGAHSWTHADGGLAKQQGETDANFKARMQIELGDTKTQLEKAIGSKVLALAYTFGYYDKPSIDAVKSYGYKLAFTVNGCCNVKDSQSNYLLKRFSIDGEIKDTDFQQDINSETFSISSKSPDDADEVSLASNAPIVVNLSDVSRLNQSWITIAVDWTDVATVITTSNGKYTLTSTDQLKSITTGFHTISVWSTSVDGNFVNSCWMIKVTN